MCMNSKLRGEAVLQGYFRQNNLSTEKRSPKCLEYIWFQESVWVPLALVTRSILTIIFLLAYSFLPLIPLVIQKPNILSLLLVCPPIFCLYYVLVIWVNILITSDFFTITSMCKLQPNSKIQYFKLLFIEMHTHTHTHTYLRDIVDSVLDHHNKTSQYFTGRWSCL